MEPRINFTKHAKEKFAILKRHGFVVSKKFVLDTVKNPDFVDYSRWPLKIAQSDFDKMRVFRVVYKQSDEETIIITFYPGRKTQYEKK